jgi:predicted small lipoprotein YifL
MKRYLLCLVVAAAAAASSGCGRKGPPEASQTASTEGRLASRVRTGDPRAAQQLVTGFYAIENGAWRWTGRKFEVELGVPAGAATSGAVLECRFNMPPTSVEKLKTQTLSASIGGEPLKPATLDTAGLFTYSREIPANLLAGSTVKVAFELDKALKPDNGDARELGVVASEFSLKAH